MEVIRLFVYGSLLPGERDADLLADCSCLGPALTAPEYLLFDLSVYPALVAGGETSVLGRIYAIDKQKRFAIDVRKENPRLFHRAIVHLADGSEAESYFMTRAQVRGKPRIASGDWSNRFAPARGPRRRRTW